MTYKNILVHVGEGNNVDATLQAACELANQFDAHLTGIYVIPPIVAPIYAEAGVPAEYLDAQEKANQEAADEAESKFNKAIGSAGRSGEWHSTKGYVDEQINRLSRYADLVVLGQTGVDDNSFPSHSTQINVLLGSARPVLIIPYIGYSNSLGKNILVAWNDSKEATRAVNDAMPILERADNVDVMAVTRDGDQDVPAADICLYLARHGVKAEADKMTRGDLTTSDLLLNRASDRGIDLIVMGAYGHSRLRELVLGGATYNILKHMTVPVLMSH